MTLPLTRNTTYAASTQVLSADLNDLQDQIIALHARDIRIRNYAPRIGWDWSNGGVAPFNDVNGEPSIGSLAASIAAWVVPLTHLREGDILESVEVHTLEPNAVGEVFNMSLYEYVAGVFTQQIGDTITSGSTGGAVTQTWDDTTNDSTAEIPYTVPSNGLLVVACVFAITTTNNESQIRNIRTTIQ